MKNHINRCLLAVSVGALLVATGCEKKQEAPESTPTEAASSAQPDKRSSATAPEPGEVSGSTARELVDEGATLLDVRTPGEYRSGHIDGAINIPIQAFAQKKEKLKALEAPIVVYCQSGVRSARAFNALQKLGFEKVYDLGGIGDW